MAGRVRWRGLELPVQVKVDQDSLNKRYGEFYAEPFERGFGHTLGNSLRRVLLSSLEGSAVVAVKIDGVQQEFSTIPGVREDVVEIVLNIKQMVVKLLPNNEKVLRLETEGPGDVTAGDIEEDPDVEIVNPDHKIATLVDDVEFSCQLTVRKGRGYMPSEEHDLPQEIGLIPMDSLFSPVQRVAYRVEDTRVGRKMNYDRLIMQVWTNGVVEPQMALIEGAKILRKHLNPFVQYAETGRLLPREAPEPLAEGKQLEEPVVSESQLTMPLEALDLSARASNCLMSEDIKTVGELLRHSRDDLLAIKNFGEVTLQEVEDKLAEQGLEIGLLAPEEEDEEE